MATTQTDCLTALFCQGKSFWKEIAPFNNRALLNKGEFQCLYGVALSSTIFRSNWNEKLWKVRLLWREGETGVPREKPSWLGRELHLTTNSTHIQCMASTPGIEPGPHWWEANALTTAPSLIGPTICTAVHVHACTYWNWLAFGLVLTVLVVSAQFLQ